jgi:AICAR transformylase/IMP cyclohydrolase PurH
VYDKRGIDQLASKLFSCGVEMISTGGTFQLLASQRIPVLMVSSTDRIDSLR